MNKAKSLIENVAAALLVEANLIKHTINQVHETLSKEAKSTFDETDGDKYKALDSYVNMGYRPMNTTLRGVKSKSKYHNSPQIHKDIENLKTITRNKTKHTFIGYRGLAKPVYGNLNEGDIVHDKGFTSVSMHPGVASQFHKDEGQKLKIHVKSGTKGYYASGHSKATNSSEHEFVLHPGTKFKVGKTQTDVTGQKWINLHVHSQED